MEDIRNMLKLKFSGNQAKESSIHLAFRFPDGKKLNYIFDGHDTTMVGWFLISCFSNNNYSFTFRLYMSLFLLWEK